MLIDDFSLLNASLSDAHIEPLGFESGYDLGNPEAVHRVVEAQFLRNDQIVHTDDWQGRRMVLPVEIKGLHLGALADMDARIHLAMQRPQKVTLIPCDEWGAPSWWRVQWATFDAVTDDFAQVSDDPRHAYTITLGVEAWAHSVDPFTVVGTNAAPPLVLFDATVDTTGWTAENGTLDVVPGSYVGMLSDGSSLTKDTLVHETEAWDPTGDGYTTIAVEAKVNTSGGVGDLPWPAVSVQGRETAGGSPWETVTSTLESRTDMGSGWYEEVLTISGSPSAMAGLKVIASGGSLADQDLKVRKITLNAGNTLVGSSLDVFVDVPGSAPTRGDLTVTKNGAGLFLYTFPNIPEALAQPILGSGGAVNTLPEGTYHLIVDGVSGTATKIAWEVKIGSKVYQSGSIAKADLPFGESGLVCIANNIYLPPAAVDPAYTGSVGVTLTGVDGTLGHGTVLLPWVGNAQTGTTATYTILGPGGDASSDFKYLAPSATRPQPAYLVDGIQDDVQLRVSGDHQLDPGPNRVFVYWSGFVPVDPEITWSGYPSWHTHAVPESRWGDA